MSEARIRDLERELSQEKQTSQKLQDHLQILENRFDKYVSDQKELESRRLRTALVWAGGIILALGAFIFNDIIWPVIKAAKP